MARSSTQAPHRGRRSSTRQRLRRLAAVAALGFAGTGMAAVPGAEAAPLRTYTAEFGCLGLPQVFSVPPGVTSLSVTAVGAGGGTMLAGTKPSAGGTGGVIKADLTVPPLSRLTVTVGCTPLIDSRDDVSDFEQDKLGGFGFARGGNGGAGGGGATAIVLDGVGPVVVAGGGGGQGGLQANKQRGLGGDGGANDGRPGSGGVPGGRLGGSPVPAGADGDGRGGGGGGGYPTGGGGGAETSVPAGAGGGGGGGMSYVDTNVATLRARLIGTGKPANGSVTITFRAAPGLAVPEVFLCTGRPATWKPPLVDGAPVLTEVTAVGASGGRGFTDHPLDEAVGGRGAGLTGFVITSNVLTIQAGCEGQSGKLANYAREIAPGGSGGYGIVRGGDGGTGNKNALSFADMGGTGGCGGGGASGVSFTGSVGGTIQMVAGGGGGCGGQGGRGVFHGPNTGGNGGNGGAVLGAGGTDGATGGGSLEPGLGGVYAGGGPAGGSSGNFIGTLMGGGGGGGGGLTPGSGGGGARSANSYAAGGGGGGGGSSTSSAPGGGLQGIQNFDATGLFDQHTLSGVVIITPIYD